MRKTPSSRKPSMRERSSMKRSHEAGLRWLRQARHDLSIARRHQENGDFSDASFSGHITPGRILDQYYIPTRYPDALAPPAVPFESYSQEQGEKALGAAEAMVSLVAQKLLPGS